MTLSKKNFKVTLFETKPLVWWRSHRAQVDMDPSYQRRGHIWSEGDKAYLIDSILNGYDVPKLYIADFTWTDSNLNMKRLPYAIIDGKQRLEAIFDFFDGTIVLDQDFVFLDDPSLKLGGLSYKDLKQNHEAVAEIFEVYPLTVMSVIAQSEEPISQLFVRLNRSKSLTGAEIRNAMSGPAPELVRQIAKHDFFVENIRFQVLRGQDLNLAAKLLLFEYTSGAAATKKKDLDSFVEKTRGPESLTKIRLAGRMVLDGLDNLATVFLPKDFLLAGAGIIPVYYWFIRGITEGDRPFVRSFLVDFERKRRANRDLLETDSDSLLIDKRLVEYDNYNRSTNDLQSQSARIQILQDKWITRGA